MRKNLLALGALLGLLCSVLSADDEVARLVERMARVGSCTSPTFSPDGARVAFVSTLGGVGQVWVMPAGGGFPELVTAGEDPVLSVRWSPDGKWLAYLMAPGGGLNSQLYVVRPDGTGARMLTAGGKVNNWLSGWTQTSNEIAIAFEVWVQPESQLFTLPPAVSIRAPVPSGRTT